MFRPKNSHAGPALLLTTIGLLVAAIIATMATIWMAVEFRHHQAEIQRIIDDEPERAIDYLRSQQATRRWELLSVAVDLVVLLAAATALLLVWRAYWASQKRLREVKTLAWDILASIDQAVVTSNDDGLVTSINPLAQELLGIDQDVVGQPLADVFDESVPLAGMAIDVLASTASEYDHDFAVTRDGHPVQLRAEGHLLRDVDHLVIGVVMYVRDITERLLTQDQMRRMERFMGLGTLAAGLHHEIKNPLSALSLHVQLLEEGLQGNDDHDVQENLGVLKTEVTRINGVLESFRDFASLATLKRSDTDLTQLIKQIAELMRPKAEQQRVKLDFDLPDEPPPLISADGTRLEQVLLNLVINSLDSMRQGGTLGLALHQSNGTLQIDVSDTGPGIPENVQARIFDPYFTTKSDGSGMGLAVCDKVVQQHNGQLAFRTSKEGTVFQISLPVGAN